MDQAMEFDISIQKTLRSGKREFELNATFDSASKRLLIFGPSGSGKSLTLKAIAGLMTPDSGHIRLGGTTLFDQQAGINLLPQQRAIGYMFQDYALFPHLNVRQNIGFGLAKGWFNPGRNQANAAVDHWLDVFKLNEVAHQFPAELSGGQRQRTALARALVNQPRALLLDEPFAALDPELRDQMRHELDQLQQALALPMIVISHDQADARLLANEVVRLRDGKVDRRPERGNGH
jgi:molybdate transport system ATP-binding protein